MGYKNPNTTITIGKYLPNRCLWSDRSATNAPIQWMNTTEPKQYKKILYQISENDKITTQCNIIRYV